MITSEKYLLYILGVNKEQLDYLLTHIEDYYYSFERVKFNKFTDKPKKNSNGEIATRQINSSRGKLKEVQTRLYDFMSKQVKIPQYVYGGKYQVPQGIPTSTLIANLVFKPIGMEIDQLAKEHHIKFSMFVDDITLSSKVDFKNLVPQFLAIIKKSGFRISHKKTHYQTKNPIITGVICQNNRLLAPLGYKKKIAILSKQLSTHEFIKNKLQGIKAYLSIIEKSSSL